MDLDRAAIGVILWIVLSAAFGIYIQSFSSYGAAYGAFGAAIVPLLWLYLSANAFLFGGEVNAELERRGRGVGSAPPAPSPPPSATPSEAAPARSEPPAAAAGGAARERLTRRYLAPGPKSTPTRGTAA